MKKTAIESIINFYSMGSNAKCVLYGTNEKENRHLLTWVQKRLGEIIKIASFYKPDSEINLLLKGKYVSVSKELLDMIRISQHYHKETGGYCDITLGAVKALWHQAKRTHETPSKTQLENAFQSGGMDKIEVDGDRIKINDSALRLDLSEIAKGYAIDDCINFLKTSGSQGGIINIGGDIKAFGSAQGVDKWKIGIQDPRPGLKSLGYITFSQGAIATSGNIVRYAVTGKMKLGHIFNPPMKNFQTDDQILTVTISTENCTDADVMATTVVAMGMKKALAYLNNKSSKVKYLIIAKRNNRSITFQKNMEIHNFVLKKNEIHLKM